MGWQLRFRKARVERVGRRKKGGGGDGKKFWAAGRERWALPMATRVMAERCLSLSLLLCVRVCWESEKEAKIEQVGRGGDQLRDKLESSLGPSSSSMPPLSLGRRGREPACGRA